MERLLPAVFGCALGIAALTGCEPNFNGVDHPEVMARWELNYFQPCPSWLRSHVSGKRYCASPAFTVQSGDKIAAPTGPKYDETKTDLASLTAAGKEVYGGTCAACHQAEGQGLAGQFPPLAGSGEFYGAPQNMARIIVHGLNGEITVQGQTYNGAMPPQGGGLSDYEVAAVATFVRHSWGNDDGIVLPSDVKAVR